MADVSGRNMRKRKAPSEDPNPRPTVAPRTTVSEKPTITKPPKAPVAPKAAPPASYDPIAAEPTEASAAKAEGGGPKLKINVGKKKAPPRKRTPPPPEGQLFFHRPNYDLQNAQKQVVASLNRSQPSAVQEAPVAPPTGAPIAQPLAAPNQVPATFDYGQKQAIPKDANPLEVVGRYVSKHDKSKSYYHAIRWEGGLNEWGYVTDLKLGTHYKKLRSMVSAFDKLYAKKKGQATESCVRPPADFHPFQMDLKIGGDGKVFEYFGHAGVASTAAAAASTTTIDESICAYGSITAPLADPTEAADEKSVKAARPKPGWVKQDLNEGTTKEDEFRKAAEEAKKAAEGPGAARTGYSMRRRATPSVPTGPASTQQPTAASQAPVLKATASTAPKKSTTSKPRGRPKEPTPDAQPEVTLTSTAQTGAQTAAPLATGPEMAGPDVPGGIHKIDAPAALGTAPVTLPEDSTADEAAIPVSKDSAVTTITKDAIFKTAVGEQEPPVETGVAPAPLVAPKTQPPKGSKVAAKSKEPGLAQEKAPAADFRAERRARRDATAGADDTALASGTDPATTLDNAPKPTQKAKPPVQRKKMTGRGRAAVKDAGLTGGLDDQGLQATVRSSADVSFMNAKVEDASMLLKKTPTRIILRCIRKALEIPAPGPDSKPTIETTVIAPRDMRFEAGSGDIAWVANSLELYSREGVVDKAAWDADGVKSLAEADRALVTEEEDGIMPATGSFEALYLIGWVGEDQYGVRKEYRQFVPESTILLHVTLKERADFEKSLPLDQQDGFKEKDWEGRKIVEQGDGKREMDARYSQEWLLTSLGLDKSLTTSYSGAIIRKSDDSLKAKKAMSDEQTRWWVGKLRERQHALKQIAAIDEEVAKANKHILEGGNLPTAKRMDPESKLELLNYVYVNRHKANAAQAPLPVPEEVQVPQEVPATEEVVHACWIERFTKANRPGFIFVEVRDVPSSIPIMEVQQKVQELGPKFKREPTAPIKKSSIPQPEPEDALCVYGWSQKMISGEVLDDELKQQLVRFKLVKPVLAEDIQVQTATAMTKQKTFGGIVADDEDDYLEEEEDQEQLSRWNDQSVEHEPLGDFEVQKPQAKSQAKVTGGNPTFGMSWNAAEEPVVGIRRWIDAQMPGRIHIEVRGAPTAWRSTEVRNQVQSWGPRSTGEKTPSKPMLLGQQIVHGRQIPASVIYEWTQDVGDDFVLSANHAQQTVILKPNAGVASSGGMVPNGPAKPEAMMEEEMNNEGEMPIALGAATKITPRADQEDAEQDLDRAGQRAFTPTLTSTDLDRSFGVKRGREVDDEESDDVVVPSKRLRPVQYDSPMDPASGDEAGFEAPNQGMSGSDGLVVPGSMDQETDDAAESVPPVNGLPQILLPPQDSRSSQHNKRRGFVEDPDEEDVGFVERAGKRQRLNGPHERAA